MIKIPSGQDFGTYSGTNTVSAIDAAQFCGWAGDYNSTSTVSGDLVYCDNSGRLWTPTAIIGGAATTFEWGGYGIDEDPDFCIGVADRPACNYCDDLNTSNYAGYTDGWELPTCVDDDTLPSSCVLYQFGVDNCSWDGGDGGQDSCQPSWDTNAQDYGYWSSSEDDSNNAWYVDFDFGGVYSNRKDYSDYVRCVRGQ
jgi:hypothetical protein